MYWKTQLHPCQVATRSKAGRRMMKPEKFACLTACKGHAKVQLDFRVKQLGAHLQMRCRLLELHTEWNVCKRVLDAPQQWEVLGKACIHVWRYQAVGVGWEVVEQHRQLALLQYCPEEVLNPLLCHSSQVVRWEHQYCICYALLALRMPDRDSWARHSGRLAVNRRCFQRT